MRAGNVIVAASRQRTPVEELYPGAGIYPSDTKPDTTSARSAVVYWTELQVPGGGANRAAVVYWFEAQVPLGSGTGRKARVYWVEVVIPE